MSSSGVTAVIGIPSTAVMMSPSFRPAFAAGLSGTTAGLVVLPAEAGASHAPVLTGSFSWSAICSVRAW